MARSIHECWQHSTSPQQLICMIVSTASVVVNTEHDMCMQVDKQGRHTQLGAYSPNDF